MRSRCSCVLIGLILMLSALAFSQPAQSSPDYLVADYRESSIDWPSQVPGAAHKLTISGPEGFYLKKSFPAGVRTRFSLLNEQGRPLADGRYKWELVVQPAASEEPGQAGLSKDEVHYGWFEIQGGKAVSEQNPVDRGSIVVEQGAPDNAVYIDSEGRVGLGTSIPSARLDLKGTDPGLAIEDTRGGGHQYMLRSRQGGDGSLGLFDETAGAARWLVDAEGRIGINTTQPTSTLTVDGYIETTKGFLVNGRPLPAVGGFTGSQPLMSESSSNNFFGTGAGAANTTGTYNSFFGGNAGNVQLPGFPT